MTPEERKEFEKLIERVDYLEHASRKQTKLISKMSDIMYELTISIKNK